MRSSLVVPLLLLLLTAFPAPWTDGPHAADLLYPVAARQAVPGNGTGNGALTAYLLGGWSREGWLSSEASAPSIRGGEKYRFFSIDGEVGAAAGSAPLPFGGEDGPCNDILAISFPTPPKVQGDLVAVGGSFNPLPRLPKSQSTDPQVYKDAAAAILREKGIKSPRVVLTRIIRVDLDGDGSEEVLVSATYYAKGLGPSASAGDYSMVFLRRLVKGKVVTRVVAGDFFPEAVEFGAPGEYRVGAVLDLNGDGIMEIVLFGRYYEGDWVEAHRLDREDVVKIFSNGCGA